MFSLRGASKAKKIVALINNCVINFCYQYFHFEICFFNFFLQNFRLEIFFSKIFLLLRFRSFFIIVSHHDSFKRRSSTPST